MFTLLDTFGLSGRTVRVLFVDRPRSWAHEQLAEELYGQHRPALLTAEFVVVREPVDASATLSEIRKRDWRPLIERIPRCGLLALYSNQFRHRLSKNLNRSYGDDLDDDQREGLIAMLRQREIEHFVDSANALIRVRGPWILRLPSKKYAQEFLRVGSIQTNKPALDAIFFWMLPHLKNCGAILTETWTISSLSFNASRLLANYCGSRPCRVDMLSRYHDGTVELRAEMKAAFERAASEEGDILFLISACMSGRLERQCRRALAQIDVDPSRVNFLSLVRLADGVTTAHLCDLSERQKGFENEEAVEFEGRSVIEIDRTTYFPLRQEDKVVSIRKDKVPEESGSGAIKEYADSGWISLHRDSIDLSGQRLRHHCIYVDVPRLLETPSYRSKLAAIVLALEPPPVMVVTPPHIAGQVLGREVASLLERSGAVLPQVIQTHGSEEDLEDGVAAKLESMSAKESIMILDDVSITGVRLSSLQEAVRRLGFSGRIHYLVGVARPERRATWKDHIQKLRYRDGFPASAWHTVAAVECVVMPDWGKKLCPWCREEELYRQLLEDGVELAPDLVARLGLLQNREDSSFLGRDAFLRPQRDSLMELTKNSVFLGTGGTHADVVAAVGNRLQRMRSGEDEIVLGGAGFPEHEVLDLECYMGKTFNDSILRAALLRMSARPEVEFSRAIEERRRVTRALQIVLSSKSTERDLSCELMLASVQGHLGSFNVSDEEWNELDQRADGAILRQLHQAVRKDL